MSLLCWSAWKSSAKVGILPGKYIPFSSAKHANYFENKKSCKYSFPLKFISKERMALTFWIRRANMEKRISIYNLHIR